MTEEELEQAACTSYCYWYVFNFPHSDGDDAWKSLGDDQSTIRLEMAKREARRHFLSEDKNMDKSLKTLKDSLVWRKSKNIDELRLCFASEDVKARISDESLKSRVEEMEKHVTKELVENQPSFAAGYDLKGAAYAVSFNIILLCCVYLLKISKGKCKEQMGTHQFNCFFFTSII